MEHWRDISNKKFKNQYQVSSLYRVRGNDRKDSIGRTIKGKVRKLSRLNNEGVRQCAISVDNIQHTLTVEQLVEQEFGIERMSDDLRSKIRKFAYHYIECYKKDKELLEFDDWLIREVL